MNQIVRTIKNNLFPFIVFMILVVGCVLGWYYFHPSSPYFERYRFVVSYQAIGTLSPGNHVIVRGIQAGKILDVELTDDAVFVTVEVLSMAKISRHSEFRLINAGLMGEREMCVLTADDDDWVVDGDTVSGTYDDGIAGVGAVFLDALKDLDEMKQAILAFKDSVTIGSSGKKMGRIVKKGKRLLNSGKSLVDDSRDQVQGIISHGESTLEKLRSTLDGASERGNISVEKGRALLDRTDSLLSRLDSLKGQSDALVEKLSATDNTAGLVFSGRGKLFSELDRLSLDIDRLISDIKKSGLKLNVDIF